MPIRKTTETGGEWDAVISRLANTVRLLREKENLSLRDLADKLGVSFSDLHRIENGTTRSPSVYFLNKIAKHFGLTIDELMNFDAKPCPTCGGRGWVK